MFKIELKTKGGFNLSFDCKDWTTRSEPSVISFEDETTNVVVIPIQNVEFLITNGHPVKITKE